MAIQTIETFYLGVQSDLDTNDSNFQSENASALVGQTFGSSGTPLYENIESLNLDDANNDSVVRTNDSTQTGENIEYQGTSAVLDSVQTYNVTITYIDGTTAPAHLVVIQDVTGRTFVTSWNTGNADNAPLSAAPIESIQVDSVNIDAASGLRDDLVEDVFIDGTVDGTSGDDNIGESYTDADGTQMNAYGGDDTVFGGDGQDTISAGGGDDVIDGGNDADVISGGDGQDTITGGSGDDVIDGGNNTDFIYGGDGNDAISDTGGSRSDDTIFGEAGDDTISGGLREDYLDGGDDADTFILEDNFGNDTIIGGEGGTDNDTIDLSALTGQATVSFSGDGQGTISSGGSFANFSQIEQFILPNGETVASGSAGDVITVGDTGANGLGGGSGDDTLSGGDGNDGIGGGDGDDLIFGDGGDDGIGGGAGDDVIFGGAGDDGIGGDAGNDTIYAGDGNDGFGGGDGNDLLFGGDGNDGIGGDAGNDTLDGGAGNDSMGGGSGNDVVQGGSGNDDISGDSGDDTVDGGTGDDVVAGGTGNDSLVGGSGNDTFIYNVGDGSDTIADFNTGNSGTLDDGDSTNNDSIDLSGFYDSIFELHEDQADDGILNQSNTTGPDAVDYSDNDRFASGEGLTFTGVSADSSSFTSESTGVVCFTTGTAIRTPIGDVLIDDLKVGDQVTTMDNGPQRIAWIGRRHVTHSELLQNDKLHPVLIKKGAMGATRDLLVSRQHGMLLGQDNLGRAAHLVEATPSIRLALGKRQVTYIHLMFDAHQIIFAEGAPSESFYPGPIALEMLADATRKELMTIFPNLNRSIQDRDVVSAFGPTARPFLGNRKAVRSWQREGTNVLCKAAKKWDSGSSPRIITQPSSISVQGY